MAEGTVAAGNPPMISVVIPMRNERAHIGRCLDTLLTQDYPPDRFEVIVADGVSDDGSTEVVRDFARRDARVRLCPNPERTTPFGLNAGIRAARGEVIVILGAHAFVGSDFLAENARALEKSGAEVAGGVIEAIGGNRFGEAVAAAATSRFGVGAVAFRQATQEGFVDTVAYAAYRRSILERVGLFDEELTRDQDDELNYRIRKLGGRIFLTPRIRTRYAVRTTPRALWKQYFGYGLWKVRVLQKHPATLQRRHFVPAASLAVGGGALAAALVYPRALWVALPLAAAYLLCVAAAAAATAARIGWGQLPALAAAFPILHLSYGLGSLAGLVCFVPRWWRPEPPAPPLSPRSG